MTDLVFQLLHVAPPLQLSYVSELCFGISFVFSWNSSIPHSIVDTPAISHLLQENSTLDDQELPVVHVLSTRQPRFHLVDSAYVQGI